MSDQNAPIRIRKATEADVNFIFNSWLKSMRGGPMSKDVNNTTYYSEHHKVVERLLKSCETYVACSEADVAELYGYICAEKVQGVFVLHFAYVKHTFRGIGIGSALLNAYSHDASTASFYTHHTHMAQKLAAKYNMVYNPYIALIPEYRVEAVPSTLVEDVQAAKQATIQGEFK